MRPSLALATLLSIGCNTGRLELPDEYVAGLDGSDAGDDGADDPGDSGDEPGGDTPGDPGDDPGDPGDPDDPTPGDLAGDYEGELQLMLYNGQGELRDFCWGPTTWIVEDDGQVLGRSECFIDRGPLEGEMLFLSWDAVMDPGGVAMGVIESQRSWSDQTDTFDWMGTAWADGDEAWLDAQVFGTLVSPQNEFQIEGYGWGARY